MSKELIEELLQVVGKTIKEAIVRDVNSEDEDHQVVTLVFTDNTSL